MKILLMCGIICFSLSSSIYAGSGLDTLNAELEEVMANKELYTALKEDKIDGLKKLLLFDGLSELQQYRINMNIYEEYHKYISDSAVYYIEKNVGIARSLGMEDLINESQIHLALQYSITGMYIESKALLETIDRGSLNQKLLPVYYETYGFFYDHYAQSTNRLDFYRKSELYRDSLLFSIDPSSNKYKIAYAQKIYYMGDQVDAEAILLNIFGRMSEDDPDKSMVAYYLGVFNQSDDPDMKKIYFTHSAILDIKNAIKDNASQQALALCYFESGDIDKAYKYMESAINDAIFCNVRHRTSEGFAFYPIINETYQNKENKQKDELRLYLILISLLSLFLIVSVIYVYIQMKRLSRIRKELYRANIKLNKLNEDIIESNGKLRETNHMLSEANHVKEEYIAHFFDLCSAYIDKMESFRRQLNKKVINNQIHELAKILKSTDYIDTEREELFRNFDSIFLHLYPTFIEDFNNLLTHEEKVIPKQGELLNTELRIFALIRLGIKDSTKIAGFLGYSLSTIYNYRTKARNKAAVNRDDFEKLVSQIGIAPTRLLQENSI